jgi:hypothetical protein
MKTILLCSGILSLIVCASFAADQKIRLDGEQLSILQKQCRKSAAEFNERWRSCEGERDYKDHYNTKRNICFITISAHCRGPQDGTLWVESLFNANDSTQYARYLCDGELVDDKPAQCYVGVNRCGSLDEFRELIRPYMED